MVITGNDFVQHRLLSQAAGVGMIVDDIADDSQPDLIESRNHLTKFNDPPGTVWFGTVTAFWHAVVPWIITPVESVFAS